GAFAVGCNSFASVVSVVSGETGANAHGRIRSFLAYSGPALPWADVSCRLPVGNSVSLARSKRANERRRPNEQHRDYDALQHYGCCSRPASCKFRAAAGRWLPMESIALHCWLLAAFRDGEQTFELVS